MLWSIFDLIFRVKFYQTKFDHNLSWQPKYLLGKTSAVRLCLTCLPLTNYSYSAWASTTTKKIFAKLVPDFRMPRGRRRWRTRGRPRSCWSTHSEPPFRHWKDFLPAWHKFINTKPSFSEYSTFCYSWKMINGYFWALFSVQRPQSMERNQP